MTRIQQKINWIKMHALQEAIIEPPVADPFITTWNMTSGLFTLLTQAGTYNATIDWGDGTSSVHTTGNPTHTYASAGQYQIKITGSYAGLRINNDASQKDKLIAVNAWGYVGFTSFGWAFYGCNNLVSLPNGSITGAENVTTFASCFRVCTSLTTIPADLFKYCVNVTSFLGCFYYCKNFALPTSIFNLTALQAKQPDMYWCFRVSSAADSHTGTVQPIWNYITITANNSCFQRCTALANYSQIPELWR